MKEKYLYQISVIILLFTTLYYYFSNIIGFSIIGFIVKPYLPKYYFIFFILSLISTISLIVLIIIGIGMGVIYLLLKIFKNDGYRKIKTSDQFIKVENGFGSDNEEDKLKKIQREESNNFGFLKLLFSNIL